MKKDKQEANEKMDKYKEFCRLRDYRRPGAEVPHHTEAQAFALAIKNKASHAEPAPQKTNQTTERKD